jgi:hypothetical protein
LEDYVMKKMVFYIVPIIMVIMGCASSGTPAKATDDSSPGMDLDAAIREAAAQMETKIPPKPMVAIVSVASPSTAFSTQVLTRLESTIVSSGKLVVVDRANLDKVREEQGFQLSGEVDDESAKSIGKLLGAGAIVTGSLADLGDVYSLTLKAINIETATVAVSYLADLAKSARIETLLASGGGAGTQTAQRGNTGGNITTPVVPAQPVAQEPVVPEKVYNIGDTGPAGGVVFFDKGVRTNGWRYMEAAPSDLPFKVQWGNQKIGDTGTAWGTGKGNTQRIVGQLARSGETDKAAQICDALEIGGYTDCFLPSKDELDLIYRNLKQKSLGNFGNWYWSSSEYYGNAYNCAWSQDFRDGKQDYGGTGDKDSQLSVRAVRQF